MAMLLKSPAFRQGKEIPERFASEGKEVSPPLVWESVPAGTRSLAILCDDPGAPLERSHHWAVCDIPPTKTEIVEGYPRLEHPGAAHQALNDFGTIGYDGGSLLQGTVHRLRFRLLALDVEHLDLGEHPLCEQVARAAQGHTIATAELVGRVGSFTHPKQQAPLR